MTDPAAVTYERALNAIVDLHKRQRAQIAELIEHNESLMAEIVKLRSAAVEVRRWRKLVANLRAANQSLMATVRRLRETLRSMSWRKP